MSGPEPAALPIFNATLTVGKEHRFLLISALGKQSGFIRLGDTFEGYTLKAFDAQATVLEMERGGKVTREAGPVKGGTTVIAFVEDPDGYKIELIERA